MLAFFMLLVVVRIGAVADCVIVVEIHMVYTAVVRRHGGDHAVLLKELILHRKAGFELLLLGFCFGLKSLGACDLSSVDAESEQTESALVIAELRLGGLKISDGSAGSVRHVLKEYVRVVHREGLAVILNEMIGGLFVEYLVVCKPDYLLRQAFARVFGKGLVAREIHTGIRVL